jgi:hypothetical protein
LGPLRGIPTCTAGPKTDPPKRKLLSALWATDCKQLVPSSGLSGVRRRSSASCGRGC